MRKMLTATFQHLPGIGPRKEQQLWRSGVTSWDELDRSREQQLSFFSDDSAVELTHSSRVALEERDVAFFATRLTTAELYRIAFAFPEDTLFLDIETTGLSKFYNKTTLAGWSIGESYAYWLRGTDPSALLQAISEARIVVTFNGTMFDLPFLQNEFPGIKFPPLHIDLRYAARRIGWSGGQKKVEAQLGISRTAEIRAVRGEEAPLLWYRYIRGDVKALQKLVDYNYADVRGMRRILDAVGRKLAEQNGFPKHCRPRFRFANEGKQRSKRVDGADYIAAARFATLGRELRVTDLLPGAELAAFRTVGIDLTGAETRPSGWCLLEGVTAVTKRIKTDDELVAETLAVRPMIVSIDSPLSIPVGRISFDDDDPGREEFGITRYCERLLAKRGVKSYPCLIESMRGLTARGMRLAQRFRQLGVPVIESFPGAAQDILGIPRKKTDQTLLAAGLRECGVKGAFWETKVSHDELDAITSAIVGLFLWSGRYEALGNFEEDYLIVPAPEIQIRRDDRLVIGISGGISAGKTTAGRYLEQHGFSYVRFSMVLQNLLDAAGSDAGREALQDIGAKVHVNPGQRWLCKKVLERAGDAPAIVIDGLRWPEDHAFFVEEFGPRFIHIHVDAPVDVRRQRYVESGRPDQEFDAAADHEVEQQVPLLSTLAHYVVSNVETRAAFTSKIEALIRSRRVPHAEAN
jgi:uncharacterized protein YprB with RNaseH-like and TPR domain/predicted nuclease with RNAse H fold/dephospho-CoA kinase